MRNGKFIGQVESPANESELNTLKNIVSKLDVSNIMAEIKDYGCIVKATLNNPIKKRLRNNEWVENATEITVMLYCQYGISDYNKLLEMKSRGDKNFSEFQYTVIMWTNGKARGYKCRNRYVYEGEGHRTYSDDFTELADDINKWFINL